MRRKEGAVKGSTEGMTNKTLDRNGTSVKAVMQKRLQIIEMNAEGRGTTRLNETGMGNKREFASGERKHCNDESKNRNKTNDIGEKKLEALE